MKKILLILAILLMPVLAFGAAISANTVWEVRTGGAQANGGGFVTGASGTDYSQQNDPCITTTTLSLTAGDATQAFITGTASSAKHVGNFYHVTAGSGWTPGWYQVVSYDGNDLVLNTAPGAVGITGGTARLGGAHLIGGALDDEFTEQLVGGNIVYVAKGTGTYTAGEAITQAADFAAITPVKWIGYTATRGDTTVGDDRPLIACTSANAFTVGGAYTILYNLRFTIGAAAGVSLGSNVSGINLKITGSGATALALGTSSKAIRCEGIAASGTAFSLGGYGAAAISCYAHNSTTGYVAANDDIIIESSVADTCTTGINCVSYAGVLVRNCTLWGAGVAATTGISGTTSYSSHFSNNIVAGWADGASWTTETPNNTWRYNFFYNTDDTDNVTLDATNIATATDPLLTDPNNGDFTLQASSPCLNAGAGLDTTVGVVGAYKFNIGADQDDNTAGGGGGQSVLGGGVVK